MSDAQKNYASDIEGHPDAPANRWQRDRPPVSGEPHRLCDEPLTDFVIDAGTCQRPIGHSGIHWFKGDPSGEPPCEICRKTGHDADSCPAAEWGDLRPPVSGEPTLRRAIRLLRHLGFADEGMADEANEVADRLEDGGLAEARATPPSLDRATLELAIKDMLGRQPEEDQRLHSGDLGSTPLIRPYELADEIADAYRARLSVTSKEER